MRLSGFRIQNFRSIVDTGWVSLSEDRVSALIGQNESGKTSILEAMHVFRSGDLLESQVRSDGTLPRVSCSFELDMSLEDVLEDEGYEGLDTFLSSHGNRLNLARSWTREDGFESEMELEEEGVQEFVAGLAADREDEIANAADGEEPEALLYPDALAAELVQYLPPFVFFTDFLSLLPDTIDINDLLEKNEAQGRIGTMNFLRIAGITLEQLQETDLRQFNSRLRAANAAVTKEFQKFWSQTVGGTHKVSIECAREHYSVDDSPDKAGEGYLVFWIKDGAEQLYPAQRSRGLRWFLSFFLQLEATARRRNADPVFLIDEPGGSLHAKAQENVLGVIEKLKESIQVIYATHSPFMVSTESIERVYAVERADDSDLCETRVLHALALGSAATDTLWPVYAAMGVDLSHQQVVQKHHNVILEEISAYYYMRAFCHLCGMSREVHFLPATGTSNVPRLAYMLLGWGLDFGVVVDDDAAGRRAFNELKHTLFSDSAEESAGRLAKLKGCDGIEDAFHHSDFEQYVLCDKKIKLARDVKLSKHAKTLAKPVLARGFMARVLKGDINLDMLTKTSRTKISGIVDVVSRLAG